MKTIFTNEQLQYMRDNYDKKTYREIAKELGFTEKQVRTKINTMGLTKRRKFNDGYFNNINSPNQAYWLGFIYADGYIVDNPKSATYELGMELHINDRYILEELNKDLGSQHIVQNKHGYKEFNGYSYETDSSVIRIYSKRIVKDLERYNIVPNKTNCSEFPKCNNLYFFDFLRGFCDGDGCIYVNKNNIRVQFINSNREFLEYLSQEIEQRINIHGHIYKEKEKKYRLIYFKSNDVLTLLDNMYHNKNNHFLKRKYEKFKSYYGFTA